ncbi:acyl-CoA dehydratase activase [Tissierella pigra]|uniref:2-hydroxyglutaryl-CoA dehydratase n=1 Tax=Tissierella pigra TaxID=2607614 RepID=A0A6N7XKH1_9FIRM|nr:acyl-CoA dehydratase activase [Tissierella pigra]MSU02076.1 2-hydroxyglutaryl-CoA dehydratase [Tissierella pigra]
MRIGIDVGSTTLKCIVLDEYDNIVFSSYERHYSQITKKTKELLERIMEECQCDEYVNLSISGSAGMGFADRCKIPFVQEVYATRIAVGKLMPEADVVIELGGEDAKILFLTNGLEVRMNGSCAGGTGAFIDQMATLLNITPGQMNDLAKSYDKLYTIASRCGVFAKSDVQPLLNQGAKKNDVAASIFYAVVNQTIAGLAQGRELLGNVVYLGGPLTFLSELRKSFDRTLNTEGICPEYSLYFVALGAAFMSESQKINLESTISMIENQNSDGDFAHTSPLFHSVEEYNNFISRHNAEKVIYSNPNEYNGNAYIGIDAGSTTIKMVIIDDKENILNSVYLLNKGNPVSIVKDFLQDFYNKFPNIIISSSTVTGYGEEIIKNAFQIDYGIVETIAHFTGAKKFRPNVDFIIDIGGQDIKCFKIKNGVIDNIFLNEACSSGCGSFLQTFAGALNYTIEDFANLGNFASNPVDLGSRCTVFMNSSVKQAQKDGATIEDISAGLSASVVKNALYKVIRVTSREALGKNIVVQGGTFLNNAVLRAFEMELEQEVIRPNIAGLMGAYGAALYAKSNAKDISTILTKDKLKSFSHEVQGTTCGLCSNNCRLTINTFDDGRKFISGNRCEKPLSKKEGKKQLSIYDYKIKLLNNYQSIKGKRGKIGIPMVLNMYELLPFWHKFFTELGFEVIISPKSNRDLYLKGQHTIPSDTICYPAKLVHGHIESLIDSGINNIFYPCMSYNLDEGLGNNHYNCPVVAYYPEVINANIPQIKNINFIYDYIGLHRPKDFIKKIYGILGRSFKDITLDEIKLASSKAYEEYYSYLERVQTMGKHYIDYANKNNLPIIVLAGRPYHVDPEINNGIDKLICQLGAVVISEDVISGNISKFPTSVLNQWTYHARLYAAAKYIGDKDNMNLVQLVSFGCGLDAVTTDEVSEILENEGKIYTQIKIDEITNLGAVKIRLRSLMETLNQ